MSIPHNEDSRVKVPALLHFLRLGYIYQTKKDTLIDPRNNIFVDVFYENIRRINGKDFDKNVLDDLIKEIADLTDNEKDKGQHFFERLTQFHKIKLIDLENPLNNDFRVVSELTFKGEREEFRPDITVLINGIPLAFSEVKKPNNHNGIQAEYSRMKYRMGVADFTHIFNQFQVLGFSNNMPYDDESRVKLQGSFYTTPNFDKTYYNHFREEKEMPVNEYIDEALMDYILSDNNIMSIKSEPEFATNLNPGTHANRFITSVFSKERLIFFIRYGIVYVDSTRDGLNKHIMRYPQLFAIQELIPKIKEGFERGVVWHTQGSGKTALAYFMSNVLRDYFRQNKIVTKFYFVVDRLDLLIQASDEFSYRGMTIANIDSKADFVNNIKSSVIVPDAGAKDGYKETMNVVNIHKFSEDSTAELHPKKEIQRIYFLDEVHRSYKPKGTFLANLLGSDPKGIFIGLTGTPLLKEEFRTTDIFYGGYIHKYYYNKSIADGYTLKIKKENISTQFKNNVRNILQLEEGKKIPAKDWEVVTKEDVFVDKVCQYIVDDFNMFRGEFRDNTLGSMIVTSSSEQARKIKKWFDENSPFKSALVLYDEEENKMKQDDFRGKRNKETGVVESSYDGVIVYNMLLTGFDSPRLKRLYLMREIKEHSLLQTLARVNRPYKKMTYGYVVDFVDITEHYEETNKRYLKELREDIAEEDDATDVEDIFVDAEKIKKQLKTVENKLFSYMGNIERNLEDFQKQIEPLDEKTLRVIKNSLEEYRDCYNELRMSHEDVSGLPIDRIIKALKEVSHRVSLKYAERVLADDDEDVEQIDFSELVIEFIKTGEVDLEFTGDELIEQINLIKNSFSANNDPDDSKYFEINKSFRELIKRLKEEGDSIDKVRAIMNELKEVHRQIKVLNGNNTSLTNLYRGDDSFMRIHKRMRENYGRNFNDSQIHQIMLKIIKVINETIASLGVPSEAIIKRKLRRPIKLALEAHGIASVSPRMADDIALLFIDDKFK